MPASQVSSLVSAKTSDMLVKMPESSAKLQLTLLKPLVASTPVAGQDAQRQHADPGGIDMVQRLGGEADQEQDGDGQWRCVRGATAVRAARAAAPARGPASRGPFPSGARPSSATR